MRGVAHETLRARCTARRPVRCALSVLLSLPPSTAARAAQKRPRERGCALPRAASAATAAAPPPPAATARPGVLNSVPLVAPADETLVSALKRALRVTATPGMAPEASEAQKGRKKATQQLESLTKALTAPLSLYVKGFPPPTRLHPFERALLDLTIGAEEHERTVARVDALRKRLTEAGKSATAHANRATSAFEAERRRAAGFAELEGLFERGGVAVDALKAQAKLLRALPVAELTSPTAALVGAPNVGKSSLVRLLSSGTPVVANYPFTTRGVAMGHVMGPDGTGRAVLTDTPGVLLRPDVARNRMERLTLAALAFLPCGVVFVADASGSCGVDAAGQLGIREEMRSRFGGRPWIDVLSKWDAVGDAQSGAVVGRDMLITALPGAIRVSVRTGEGTRELAIALGRLLRQVNATLLATPGDDTPVGN